MLLYRHNEGHKAFGNKTTEPSARKEEEPTMTNITLNHKNRTIELTKKFAADSSHFGTDEYKMLQEARRDYPNYKVVVVSRKNSKTNFDGLNLDYMELYISKHDDEEHSIMSEFEILLARDEDSKAAGLQAAPFLKVKSWFLNKYPVFTQAYDKQNAILDDVAAKQKAAREAKQKEMLEARRAALLAQIA